MGSTPLAMQWAVTIWLAGGATALSLAVLHRPVAKAIPALVPIRVLDVDEAPRLKVLAGDGVLDDADHVLPIPQLRVLPGGRERAPYEKAV